MTDIILAAFADELSKIAALDKEALFESLRVGLKATKEALLGGTRLSAPPGVLHGERQTAAYRGDALIKLLKEQGLGVHRARVKSPGSITANNSVGVPNDLLGLQAYAKTPQEVEQALGHLRRAGVQVDKTVALTRRGYHGVNVKGSYSGVPLEFQLSPSRRSNIGQIMEHSLAYKPATEAPWSNFIDRWVGSKVAPKLVASGSWLPGARLSV